MECQTVEYRRVVRNGDTRARRREELALIARFRQRQWQSCGDGGWGALRYCCFSSRNTSASGWNGRPKLCYRKWRAGLQDMATFILRGPCGNQLLHWIPKMAFVETCRLPLGKIVSVRYGWIAVRAATVPFDVFPSSSDVETMQKLEAGMVILSLRKLIR